MIRPWLRALLTCSTILRERARWANEAGNWCRRNSRRRSSSNAPSSFTSDSRGTRNPPDGKTISRHHAKVIDITHLLVDRRAPSVRNERARSIVQMIRAKAYDIPQPKSVSTHVGKPPVRVLSNFSDLDQIDAHGEKLACELADNGNVF